MPEWKVQIDSSKHGGAWRNSVCACVCPLLDSRCMEQLNWNYRCRRGGGGTCRIFFSPVLIWSNPDPWRVESTLQHLEEQTWNLSARQWSALQRLPLSPSSSLSVPCDNNNSSTERSCTFQLIFLLSFLLLSLIIVPPLGPPKAPHSARLFLRSSFLLSPPNLSEELNSRGFFHFGVSRQAGFLYFELRLLSSPSCRWPWPCRLLWSHQLLWCRCLRSRLPPPPRPRRRQLHRRLHPWHLHPDPGRTCSGRSCSPPAARASRTRTRRCPPANPCTRPRRLLRTYRKTTSARWSSCAVPKWPRSPWTAASSSAFRRRSTCSWSTWSGGCTPSTPSWSGWRSRRWCAMWSRSASSGGSAPSSRGWTAASSSPGRTSRPCTTTAPTRGEWVEEPRGGGGFISGRGYSSFRGEPCVKAQQPERGGDIFSPALKQAVPATRWTYQAIGTVGACVDVSSCIRTVREQAGSLLEEKQEPRAAPGGKV